MLRDYRMATIVYDAIRKDYAQDGAAKLAASATVSRDLHECPAFPTDHF